MAQKSVKCSTLPSPPPSPKRLRNSVTQKLPYVKRYYKIKRQVEWKKYNK